MMIQIRPTGKKPREGEALFTCDCDEETEICCCEGKNRHKCTCGSEWTVEYSSEENSLDGDDDEGSDTTDD